MDYADTAMPPVGVPTETETEDERKQRLANTMPPVPAFNAPFRADKPFDYEVEKPFAVAGKSGMPIPNSRGFYGAGAGAGSNGPRVSPDLARSALSSLRPETAPDYTPTREALDPDSRELFQRALSSVRPQAGSPAPANAADAANSPEVPSRNTMPPVRVGFSQTPAQPQSPAPLTGRMPAVPAPITQRSPAFAAPSGLASGSPLVSQPPTMPHVPLPSGSPLVQRPESEAPFDTEKQAMPKVPAAQPAAQTTGPIGGGKEPFIGDKGWDEYAKWEYDKDVLQKQNPGMSEGDAEHVLTSRHGKEVGAATAAGAGPEPQLHGIRNVLDRIGSIFPLGRAIETAIPGTPQNWNMKQAMEAARTETGQKLTKGQQEIDKGAREAQGAPAETELRHRKTEAEISNLENKPEPGKTPEETTLHDLMAGDNGNPRVNPDTKKPYTYLEAYQAEKGAAAGAKEPPLGSIDQLNAAMTDRFHVLNPGKPLPSQYTLPPNATTKDYSRIDNALKSLEGAEGTKATRDSAAATRNATKADKDAAKSSTVGWALDPKTNEKILTDQGTAESSGYKYFQKTTPGDVEKEEATLRQMNDVQLNVSRYRQAVNAIPKEGISKEAVNHINAILSDKDLNVHIGEGGGGIAPGLLTDVLQSGQVGKFWNQLSVPEQNVVTGYLRAKASVLAYQKALTGTGRTNKEQMDIEMNNLPAPTVGATIANPRMDAFQENIDTAAQGFGKIPWMETPKDVRGRIEKPQSAGGAEWKAPDGAPSAKGVADGKVLKQDGKIVSVAKGGAWAKP